MDKFKLIFLDIDGVLNHEIFYDERSQDERALTLPYPLSDIDPKKVSIINHIIEATGASVVISSTWRKSRTVEELQSLFEQAGFTGKIIGKTPSIYLDRYKVSVPRGLEIEEYLQQCFEYDHHKRVTYCIFDDDSDMLLHQKENYFWIDGYYGLTETIAEKAINLLNKMEGE